MFSRGPSMSHFLEPGAAAAALPSLLASFAASPQATTTAYHWQFWPAAELIAGALQPEGTAAGVLSPASCYPRSVLRPARGDLIDDPRTEGSESASPSTIPGPLRSVTDSNILFGPSPLAGAPQHAFVDWGPSDSLSPSHPQHSPELEHSPLMGTPDHALADCKWGVGQPVVWARSSCVTPSTPVESLGAAGPGDF